MMTQPLSYGDPTLEVEKPVSQNLFFQTRQLAPPLRIGGRT
jgi:hypothetical protein